MFLIVKSAERRSEIAAKQFKYVFADDEHDSFRDVCIHGPSYPAIGDLTMAKIKPSKA